MCYIKSVASQQEKVQQLCKLVSKSECFLTLMSGTPTKPTRRTNCLRIRGDFFLKSCWGRSSLTHSLGYGLKVALNRRCYFSVIVHNSNLNSTWADLLMGLRKLFYPAANSKNNPVASFRFISMVTLTVSQSASDRVLLSSKQSATA